MKALLNATRETLEQTLALISAVIGTDYNRPTDCAESGIGAHVRHILDHFEAVKVGMQTGTINYNVRARGSRIEHSQTLAQNSVQDYLRWLQTLPCDDQPINIETEISLGHTENCTLSSTLSREICYLINHTVHHLAYGRALAGHMGYKLDKSLGLAPASASFLRLQAQ